MSALAAAGDGHEKLLANAIAQAEALMVGKQVADTPHRIFPGNRPSTFMVLDALDPFHLGMLVALHEHRIFAQGVLWNIFSFDQWGVELGKVLASQILTDWHSAPTKGHDASTEDLMQRLRRSV
jgi:glucose-6-phosphate isomerase